MARTEAGYGMAVEPIEVQRVGSVDELEELLCRVIARGNRVIPTPALSSRHTVTLGLQAVQ